MEKAIALTWRDERIIPAIEDFIRFDPLGSSGGLERVLMQLMDGRAGCYDIGGTLFFIKGQGEICECFGLSGTFEDAQAKVDCYKALALSLGFKRATIHGRKGWERQAKQWGFKHLYSIMEVDL